MNKFKELQLLQLFLEVSCDALTQSMPLCPISEIPALHSLGLWPKLVALQILRRSQKIREAPTESPFVVSTLCSLHCLWQERALSTEICVLWMLYGFMKLCLRYILSKCFDIAFACFLIHGPWICFQLSMQPKLSPSPEDTATPLLVERGLLEKHEKKKTLGLIRPLFGESSFWSLRVLEGPDDPEDSAPVDLAARRNGN